MGEGIWSNRNSVTMLKKSVVPGQILMVLAQLHVEAVLKKSIHVSHGLLEKAIAYYQLLNVRMRTYAHIGQIGDYMESAQQHVNLMKMHHHQLKSVIDVGSMENEIFAQDQLVENLDQKFVSRLMNQLFVMRSYVQSLLLNGMNGVLGVVVLLIVLKEINSVDELVHKDLHVEREMSFKVSNVPMLHHVIVLICPVKTNSTTVMA